MVNMLLDKTVLMKWSRANKKYYESKGYVFSAYNNEFYVKTNDLSVGAEISVRVQCDCCNKLTNIKWQNYNRSINKYNKYFCKKCALKLIAKEHELISKLSKSKSFEQWCIENNRTDVLDRWDHKLNAKNPNQVSFSSNKKYYFKCSRNLHESELKRISDYISGKDGVIDCKKCKSFAQWSIDNIGEDFLERYWDYEKNDKLGFNPWEIEHGSNKKVWIKCQEKDYHGSYEISCNNFTNNKRCSYCQGRQVHPLDSLGKLLEEKDLLHLWSEKNKKSSYEYTPNSHDKVWWKCHNGKHEDYFRSIKNSYRYCDFRCPECQYSKGETKIDEYLIQNNIYRIPQKEFDGLVGLRNGNLSYDFYLPQYNLLIEYQGEQHDKYIKGLHQTQKGFEKQKEHDRRKREYAKLYNVKLLEIWYWDFDNVEEILKKELKL
jgi:hypothetical protein